MAKGMNEEFENELGEGLNNSMEPSSLRRGIEEFLYECQTLVAMNDALTVMFYYIRTYEWEGTYYLHLQVIRYDSPLLLLEEL